jgi:ABC-type amino acid transport substrate-binding protein
LSIREHNVNLAQKKYSHVSLITVDDSNQAMELLKADHADRVFIDEIQAVAFCKKIRI